MWVDGLATHPGDSAQERDTDGEGKAGRGSDQVQKAASDGLPLMATQMAFMVLIYGALLGAELG